MSYYMDIPDHPDIRMMERYGTLHPEEEEFVPYCPVCGKECETVYTDNDGDVIGCDCCVNGHDAFDYLWERRQ